MLKEKLEEVRDLIKQMLKNGDYVISQVGEHKTNIVLDNVVIMDLWTANVKQNLRIETMDSPLFNELNEFLTMEMEIRDEIFDSCMKEKAKRGDIFRMAEIERLKRELKELEG